MFMKNIQQLQTDCFCSAGENCTLIFEGQFVQNRRKTPSGFSRNKQSVLVVKS